MPRRSERPSSLAPATTATTAFEGLIYKGVIGTYLHGPALPKNPELADWLIAHALERRGDAQATALLPLKPLDDTYERAAHDAAMKLLP